MKLSDLNLDLIDTINLYNGMNDKEKHFLEKLLKIMQNSMTDEEKIAEILNEKKFIREMEDFLEESQSLKAPKEDVELIRAIFNKATNHLGEDLRETRTSIGKFLKKTFHKYGEGLIEDFRQKDL